MNLIWSDHALAQLDAFADRLKALVGEDSGTRFVDQMTRRSHALRDFPELGRTVPEFENPLIRELIEDDYRIVYERFPDRIEVIALVNAKMSFEDWRP